ncbi:CsbD family protein [Dyella japonica]
MQLKTGSRERCAFFYFHRMGTARFLKTSCRNSAALEDVMDKNRVEGTKHEVKGAIKEGVGKVTNNPAKEAAGNIEKNAGKIQKEIGKEHDRQRDFDKHH